MYSIYRPLNRSEPSTTHFNILNSYVLPPQSVFVCFVWITSLYRINSLVFVAETGSVYCEVRIEYLSTMRVNLSLRSVHTVCLCVLCGSENKQRLFPYTK